MGGKAKERRESALYRPVATFLEKQCQCHHRHTWIAGCGRDFAFPAGFGNRKPDVVAISDPTGQREIHLVEGKLLNIPTHGFDQTLHQLDSFRRYADFLWAAFPDDTWQAARHNHHNWTSDLEQRGYGLLLIKNGKVAQKSPARRNREVTEDRKREFLEQLLGESDDAIHVPSLDPRAAEGAARAVARVTELMAGPIREVVGGHRKESSFASPDYYDTRHAYYSLGGVGCEDAYIQGDPFGVILKDGRPVIWVWRWLGDLAGNERRIKAAVEEDHPNDVYYFADNGEWMWQCRPLSELKIEALKSGGYTGEFNLGRCLPVTERTCGGIKKDMKKLWAWARSR